MRSGKGIVYWGSAIVAGIVLGCGATVQLLSRPGMGSGISSGPWQTSLATGSTTAGLYTRAVIARRGLLALAPQETMYYTASTDSEGRALSGDCDYTLEGRDLAARWWSITAYGADSFLIPNAARRYSLSQTTVSKRCTPTVALPGSGCEYAIAVSAQAQPGNWLPVHAGERFDLTARFYNPDKSVYEAPDRAGLPRIVRGACR